LFFIFLVLGDYVAAACRSVCAAACNAAIIGIPVLFVTNRGGPEKLSSLHIPKSVSVQSTHRLDLLAN